MRMIVAVMLGIYLSFLAMTFAETEAPSPPPKAGGGLSAAEELFQGQWQLNSFETDKRLGEMRVDNRDFRAEGVHGKHQGHLSIRPDTSPPQIDFTIEECDGCDFTGKTSAGIYYREDDGAIVFAGPVPGDPRPKDFSNPNELWRMRPLDPAAEGDGE